MAPESATRERGRAPHIVSLVVGLPTSALTLYAVAGQFFGGLYAVVFLAMSVLGCVLAIIGMQSSPRRFHWSALLLTLIPGAVVAFYAAVMVALVFLLGGGNPN